MGSGELTSHALTELVDESLAAGAGDGGGAKPYQSDAGGVTVTCLFLGQAEGPEDVDPAQMTPVAERGGQDADDLVRLAVDADLAADDLSVTPEVVLPIPVRDDEDAVVAQGLFVGTEAAAELRPGAQGGKEIGGDAEGVRHLGRFAGLGEAHVRSGIGGDLAVAAGLGLEVEIIGG